MGLLLALWSPAILADELLIFHMPGCRPCVQLKQMLDENPEITQGFAVSLVDITDLPETAELFNVSTVPTVVRLDDKTREVARYVGLMTKREFEDWLQHPTRRQHRPTKYARR
jgi:thioredoxin-like negative regulator of GroEL